MPAPMQAASCWLDFNACGVPLLEAGAELMAEGNVSSFYFVTRCFKCLLVIFTFPLKPRVNPTPHYSRIIFVFIFKERKDSS
jgi:hypothetical protein